MEKTREKNNTREEVIEEIIAAIAKTKFGEVVVTIHDSKIVQIERREKKRFS